MHAIEDIDSNAVGGPTRRLFKQCPITAALDWWVIRSSEGRPKDYLKENPFTDPLYVEDCLEGFPAPSC